MRAVLDAGHNAQRAGSGLSKGWRKGPWLILLANLKIYSVYVRYFASRAGFFLFRHAFVCVASILVLGIFYSKASGFLINQASLLSSQWPWMAAALTIFAYALKKYYLDSKLKRLRHYMGQVFCGAAPRWWTYAPLAGRHEEGELAAWRKLMAKSEELGHIIRPVDPGLAPPMVDSCLIDQEAARQPKCQRQWLSAEVEAFRSELFPLLEKLACQSSAIASGLIRQISVWETTDGRFGLAGRFVTLLDKRECEGLSSLPEADEMRDLAKREEAERQGQSGAGKPAEEVPGSPNPPSPPETP